MASTEQAPNKHAADVVDIYTDGACSGNPGPGGWAAVLDYKGHRREISGTDPQTTNNRMELMAAIAGLEALKRPMRARIHTDSTYVKNGITIWIHDWRARGWRNSAKKPVKNRDLWERLLAALQRHSVSWHWVRGHAGHPGNERANAIAQDAARSTEVDSS